jgi:hypothetical protein
MADPTDEKALTFTDVFGRDFVLTFDALRAAGWAPREEFIEDLRRYRLEIEDYVRHVRDLTRKLCSAEDDRDEARSKLAEVERSLDRAVVIADEAFGPFPVQSAEDAMTAIEAGIFEQEQEIRSLRSQLAEHRAVVGAALEYRRITRIGYPAVACRAELWEALDALPAPSESNPRAIVDSDTAGASATDSKPELQRLILAGAGDAGSSPARTGSPETSGPTVGAIPTAGADSESAKGETAKCSSCGGNGWGPTRFGRVDMHKGVCERCAGTGLDPEQEPTL